MAETKTPPPAKSARSFREILAAATRGEEEATRLLLEGLVGLEGAAAPLIEQHLRHGRHCVYLTMADVLQSVLFAVVVSLPKFRGTSEGEFFKWLATIAQRKVAGRIRRAQTERKHIAAGIDPEDGPSEHPDDDALRTLVREEMEGSLWVAVAELPKNLGEVLVARVFLEQSYADIARDLDIPEATARKRYTRALEKMQERLRDDAERPD